jgi:predicted kinase/2'-5' RNA ligase
MPAVHILQGLPGSGKSTFARRQFGLTAVRCSADDFLVDIAGEYRFSQARVGEAHARCLRKFVEVLQSGGPNSIVVDNTNLTVAEMSPYVALAQAYAASTSLWLLDAPLAECFARQTHGVPSEAFERMNSELARFSPPCWWPSPTTVELANAPHAASVYVGLALRETDELVLARNAVCDSLDLLPRTEAHVTLAYLGKVDPRSCDALAEALCGQVPDELSDLAIIGTGAAFEMEAGKPVPLFETEVEIARAHPRVGWWSVEPTSVLVEFRSVVLGELAKLGLSTPDQPFYPHVTLGSRGRESDDEFDVYSILKRPTLGGFMCPNSVPVSKLHITASRIVPASIACIRAWSPVGAGAPASRF